MSSRMNRRNFVRNTMLASAGAALAVGRTGKTNLSTAALANTTAGDVWGHLTGRIVYDGEAPVPEKVKVDKDEEVCGKCGLIYEKMLVDAESGGLRNAVVYVYLKRGETIPVHPSFAETAGDEIVLNNQCCRFEPHVVLLRTSQQLVAKASDPIASNVKIDGISNPPVNQTIPSGSTLKFEDGFRKEERLPIPVSCPVHFWEKAWLVIRDNPYMAVTDFNGYFEIRNLPVGEWSFQFWHEEAGYLAKVVKDGKATSWKRGRVQIAIKPGDNDLGEIKISPEAFKH